MIWWITQSGRARSELAAITDLAENAAWLSAVTSGLSPEGRLTVDFTITHEDQAFPLKLVYPAFFPDTPPHVLPREKIRLSDHQWGEGGELCLEYRADNWDPAYTGVMMIESAYRLLAGERPADGEATPVPSAHRITEGQRLRNESFRFLLPADLLTAIKALEINVPADITFAEHLSTKHWLIQPTLLGTSDAPHWAEIPRVVDYQSRSGVVIYLGAVTLPKTSTIEALQATLITAGHSALWERISSGEDFFLLLAGRSACRLVNVYRFEEKGRIITYSTVNLPAPKQRLAPSYDALAGKSAAIVGAGSLGSKVAVSLARAGVRRFVLIDEDILYPDNLVRNELAARDIGLNKVDALAARIIEVNPLAEVLKRRIPLGGQESADSTDSAMQHMAKCDIIVDATAEPLVFNLCAAIARTERKPMVWGEVLGGGIGGLIARVRPDIDPPPHTARSQIEGWIEAQGKPWEWRSDTGYDLRQDDLPPLIADDADVTVIAAHLTRLATDTLLREHDSAFPVSAYAIGLASAWIFSEPFDTAPIAFSPQGMWGPDIDPDTAENLEALTELLFPNLPKDTDAA